MIMSACSSATTPSPTSSISSIASRPRAAVLQTLQHVIGNTTLAPADNLPPSPDVSGDRASSSEEPGEEEKWILDRLASEDGGSIGEGRHAKPSSSLRAPAATPEVRQSQDFQDS